MLSPVDTPNSPSNPKTLPITPKCSVEGCMGHCVVVLETPGLG